MAQSAGAPPVVAFVGRSGCGKTTLIEKLIPVLGERGVRVALLKHTLHMPVETDLPGKDTRRFWDAGAQQTVFVAADRVVTTRRLTAAEAESAVADALAAIRDIDLILVEGHKHGAEPKIEVVRAARDPHRLTGLTHVVALITDLPDLAQGLPCFGFDQIAALADFILALVH